mmetsp:Transcript_50480/g.163561  ORF Transcript_50480/g.163561 Transcript_50480/m.163561 type:complete len:260 (+) Transcript_50480:48-827(+)
MHAMWRQLRLPGRQAGVGVVLTCRCRQPASCTTVQRTTARAMHVEGGMWKALRVDRRAMAADFAVGGSLTLIGDIFCQMIIEGRHMTTWHWRKRGEKLDEHTFDARRVAAITSFMAVYIGSAVHFSFQAYPYAVVAAARQLAAGSTLRSHLLREGTAAHAFGCACVDNVVQGLFFFAPFFYGVGLLQGDTLAECHAALAAEGLSGYLSSIPYWMPIITANFAFVPSAHRVKVMASGTLGWSILIDFIAHRDSHRARQGC